VSTTSVVIRAPAEAVYDVLIDPQSYPLWVVGASRVRGVEREWPAEGASFHHSVGAWPLLIDDSTTIVTARPPDLIELRARAWPLGEADVRLRLEQRGELTRVTLREIAVLGPGRTLWGRPVEALTRLRNSRSLARLKRLVEGRSRGVRGRTAA
jgi:uncharacterized protein YndB with AHSA1/START domain